MYAALLSIHIGAGFTALIMAALAAVTPKGGRRHIYAGRAFVSGMALVFLTALPMTLIKPNLFLLLIAIFSFYLTLAAVTAFTVVSVRVEPAFVVWLAPTVVLTPLIIYWSARIRRAASSAARS